VKGMVVRLLGLREPPQPDDVSDALALAIAFAFRSTAAAALPGAV